MKSHINHNRRITQDNEVITSHYEYILYGELLRTDEWCITELCMFRFSSEYRDAELGLYYYNFRHYNPTDGRWLSRDPIRELGGYNLYNFVQNDPLSGTDYLGFRRIYPFKVRGENSSCPKNAPGKKAIDVQQYLRRSQTTNCQITIKTFTYRTKEPTGWEPIPNGCGPEGNDFITLIVPDIVVYHITPHDPTGNFVMISEACNAHDLCYGRCGTTRAGCDLNFYMHITTLCDGLTRFIDRMHCKSWALTYYHFVNAAASSAYEDGQDKACKTKECFECSFIEHVVR